MAVATYKGPIGRWTMTVLCLALGFAWVASGLIELHWDSPRRTRFDGCEIRKGYIAIWFGPNADGTDLSGAPHGLWVTEVGSWERDPGWQLVPQSRDKYGSTEVVVPLWIPLVMCVVPCVVWWRAESRRRAAARLGRCPACDYDMRGLPSTTNCPECGPGSTP